MRSLISQDELLSVIDAIQVTFSCHYEAVTRNPHDRKSCATRISPLQLYRAMSESYNFPVSGATLKDLDSWHCEAAAMLEAAHHTMAQALGLATGQPGEELGAVLNVLWANLKWLSRELDGLERIFAPGLSAH